MSSSKRAAAAWIGWVIQRWVIRSALRTPPLDRPVSFRLAWCRPHDAGAGGGRRFLRRKRRRQDATNFAVLRLLRSTGHLLGNGRAERPTSDVMRQVSFLSGRLTTWQGDDKSRDGRSDWSAGGDGLRVRRLNEKRRGRKGAIRPISGPKRAARWKDPPAPACCCSLHKLAPCANQKMRCGEATTQWGNGGGQEMARGRG